MTQITKQGINRLKSSVLDLRVNNMSFTSLDSSEEMQKYFEEYYKENSKFIYPKLDLTKGGEYNAYLNQDTAIAYIWFINGSINTQREITNACD